MTIRAGGSREGVTQGLSTGYHSARPELRMAAAAVRVAVSVLSVWFVASLVSAALTGWALTMDPDAGGTPIAELQVPAPVLKMVTTAAWLSAAAGAGFVLTVASAAVFVIRWQTRAVHNLPALGQRVVRRPAWCSGLAWFVPGWGFLAPKQTFDDLWRCSEPTLPREPEPAQVDQVVIPAFHSLWWGLWVTATVVNAVVTFDSSRDPSAAMLADHQLISAVLALALVGAGLAFLRVLGQTTDRQDVRHARLAASTMG